MTDPKATSKCKSFSCATPKHADTEWCYFHFTNPSIRVIPEELPILNPELLQGRVQPPENTLVLEQKAPVKNDLPAVWQLVMDDFRARDAEGRRKYGVPLQPMNGRNSLVDAYQEGLDQVVYIRAFMIEMGLLSQELRDLNKSLQREGFGIISDRISQILKKYPALDAEKTEQG